MQPGTGTVRQDGGTSAPSPQATLTDRERVALIATLRELGALGVRSRSVMVHIRP